MTTTAPKMREIPPLQRDRLIAAGKRCQAAPDHEKARHLDEISKITDELARAGVVHPRNLSRPEFDPPSGIRKQQR